MRNVLSVFAAALAGSATPGPVFAWGNEGHQIVALVAERHLTPGAVKAVDSLLGSEGGQLENVATWADCIKRSSGCAADDGPFDQKAHPETRPWHFVDILVTAQGYDPALDCANDSCVVAKIAGYRTTLADAGAPAIDRLIALKFLVHFVGDAHQPLHAAYKKLKDGKSDEGGNLRFVRAPAGAKTDLHAFWDTGLVRAELSDFANALAIYATALDQGTAPSIGDLDPIKWANESHHVAAAAYKYAGVDGPHGFVASDPVILKPPDVTRWRKLVRQQLRLAGLRLAAVLNEALDPEGAKRPVATRDLDSAGFRD